MLNSIQMVQPNTTFFTFLSADQDVPIFCGQGGKRTPKSIAGCRKNVREDNLLLLFKQLDNTKRKHGVKRGTCNGFYNQPRQGGEIYSLHRADREWAPNLQQLPCPNFGLAAEESHMCTTCWTRGILLWANLHGMKQGFTKLKRRSKSTDLWVGRYCLEKKRWKKYQGGEELDTAGKGCQNMLFWGSIWKILPICF